MAILSDLEVNNLLEKADRLCTIDLFQRYLDADATGFEFYRNIRRLIAKSDNEVWFIEILRTAIVKAPDRAIFHICLAELYLRTGSTALALDASNMALNLDPSSGLAKILQMQCLLLLTRLTELEIILEGLSGKFATAPAVKAIKRDLAGLLFDYEYALHLAADLCEDEPESKPHLVAFRSIYSNFSSHEKNQRLQELHEAVGIQLPTSSITAALQSNPKTSAEIDVVVPIHNGLNHVQACLAGLLEETRQAVRSIILVDDCSTADTAEFLSDLADKNKKIVLVRTERHCGFTDAIMFGLTFSKAPLFVALNSDTVTESDWLERLLETYNSSPNIGMVGPLSNSAAWQNLDQPFAPDGNFQKHEMPSGDVIQQINAKLSLNDDRNFPFSPLVHGFCALVNRDAFDKVGGLDSENFPRGYGEFQDLSLRLWDAGYELKIATHCFVAHFGFGSIDPGYGSDLSLAARKCLYRKHSALRYLMAESASAFSKPLEILRVRMT